MLTYTKETKIENVSEFNQWLQAKLLERNWKATDLARHAGLGNSTITRILDGTRNPGKDVCMAIALALGEEVDYIFKLAGLLPDSIRGLDGLDSDEAEWLELYRKLSIGERAAAKKLLRGLVEPEERQR